MQHGPEAVAAVAEVVAGSGRGGRRVDAAEDDVQTHGEDVGVVAAHVGRPYAAYPFRLAGPRGVRSGARMGRRCQLTAVSATRRRSSSVSISAHVVASPCTPLTAHSYRTRWARSRIRLTARARC